MTTIHVAGGVATGPTAMASYDAALAEANLHNYNLVPVSSVVPADATVERVESAPDLGPAGNRLTVVQARATTTGPGRVSAGLGWTTGPGPGLFYEAAAEADAETIRERVEQGLAAGRALRDWEFEDERVEIASVDAEAGVYTTAVVLAAYGESEPIR
ncbi:MAG: pyruvoyl-dependent arginine decarboxylase [Haloferacaceae archaeon]